jgi:hypothetical protein
VSGAKEWKTDGYGSIPEDTRYITLPPHPDRLLEP